MFSLLHIIITCITNCSISSVAHFAYTAALQTISINTAFFTYHWERKNIASYLAIKINRLTYFHVWQHCISHEISNAVICYAQNWNYCSIFNWVHFYTDALVVNFIIIITTLALFSIIYANFAVGGKSGIIHIRKSIIANTYAFIMVSWNWNILCNEIFILD